VERALELQGELRERLIAVLASLERSKEPTADDFLEALEVNRMEQHYTPEQLAQLEQRRKELGEELDVEGPTGLGGLIADATAAKERGIDAASDKAQSLATRWQDHLISQFTGGDSGTRASLQKMYETEGPEQASRRMWTRNSWSS
jgi:hypothetical protein